MTGKDREHMFSIELKSREYVKSLAMPNEERGTVLIEGFLGELQGLRFVEGIMLEVNGDHGNLRMDFTEKELRELLPEGFPTPQKTAKETRT